MLWNQPGVPQKGWVCVGMEDLGEGLEHMDAESRKDYYESCSMCGNEGIRYVHIMRHDNYVEDLRVGQQCAEKMENNYVEPKRREKNLKNRYGRLRNFLKQTWNIRQNGNHVLKYKGYQMTIVRSRYGAGYGVYVGNKKLWENKGKKILTIEQAKIVAFDLMDN